MMKEKIYKFFMWDVVPILIFILLLYISAQFKNSAYFSLSILYIVTNYFVIKSILTMGGFFKKKVSLYDWMDILPGYDSFSKQLFSSKKEKGFIENIESVYEKLMKFSKRDVKKLKLMRGYFRTVIDERPLDIIFKTFLGIIVATIVWSINKGVLLRLSERNANSFEILGINTKFVIGMNFISILLILMAGLVVIIRQFFEEKNRNKIILEVLEVCIEEVDVKK